MIIATFSPFCFYLIAVHVLEMHSHAGLTPQGSNSPQKTPHQCRLRGQTASPRCLTWRGAGEQLLLTDASPPPLLPLLSLFFSPLLFPSFLSNSHTPVPQLCTHFHCGQTQCSPLLLLLLLLLLLQQMSSCRNIYKQSLNISPHSLTNYTFHAHIK